MANLQLMYVVRFCLLHKNEHFVLCLELGGYSMKQNVDVLGCDVEFDPFTLGESVDPEPSSFCAHSQKCQKIMVIS